ncbi:MAG TPA: tetratricopeptide repeat protein [Gemmataceae bacterium]|nr:tetratricopeptide repeat protein [Gemmataceae bacterium]
MLRKWKIWTAIVVLCLVLSAGAGYWWYGGGAAPQAPAVDTTGREPEIAAAISAAQTKVRQQPRSGDAWGRLGMLLLIHAYEAEADLCLTQAERLAPRQPRWPYYRGMIKELRDPEAALPLLRHAAGLAGDTSVPRLHLAELLANQGHWDEAAAEFRHVLRDEPNNPRAHLGLGRLLYQQGDLDGSLEHLNRAAAAVPNLRATHALLAEIHKRRKERQDEERELALLNGSQDLDWPDPYWEELQALQVGVEAQLERADRLVQQNRKEEAIRLLVDTVRSAPHSYKARLSLARRLLQVGNADKAEQQLRAARRLEPDSFEVLAELGMILQKRGEYREAAECYRRVIALQPAQAMAHFHLANCREQLGDRAGAIAALRTAQRCKPEFALAHKVLGRLLAEMNQDAEAMEQLQQALRLQPDDAQTRQLLERVSARRKK